LSRSVGDDLSRESLQFIAMTKDLSLGLSIFGGEGKKYEVQTGSRQLSGKLPSAGTREVDLYAGDARGGGRRTCFMSESCLSKGNNKENKGHTATTPQEGGGGVRWGKKYWGSVRLPAGEIKKFGDED